MGKKLIDLVGEIFGHLTVIRRADSLRSHATWLCQCDCGNLFIAQSDKLRAGRAVSCGCRVGGATHGHTRGQLKRQKSSPTFRSWNAMIGRCTYPSVFGFEYYKWRGINVCDRWRYGEDGKSGFEYFLEDMGERPSLEYSLDRYPNNDGNYEPGNCRWATKSQQGNNRSDNQIFVYRGRKFTITELARETGVPIQRLRHRLLRASSSSPWTVEEAVSTPKGGLGTRPDRRHSPNFGRSRRVPKKKGRRMG
jgi:hypothetical protein